MGGKALLIVVVGFMIVSSYTVSVVRNASARAGSGASENTMKANSRRLALSGAKLTLAKINQDTSWRGSISKSPRSQDGGNFVATFARIPSSNLSILRSVSNYPLPGGTIIHDTVDLLLRKNFRNSFSVLAWMTNSEGSVTWISGDTVWGKMHTNGTLRVSGSPCFTGLVSCTGGFKNKPGTGGNYGKYLDGYDANADSIILPSDLSEITAAATSGGRRYVGNIWVTLNPNSSSDGNGTVEVRMSSSGPIVETVSLSSLFNGVIQSTGALHVKGTLDGRLTLSSLQDIYVDDNVLYERDPRTGPSNDILGLVAERNVIVTDNTANRSDAIIQASVFARSGSFLAENSATRPLSGELRVLGSIVQNVRGAVGSFNTTTGALKSGFSKRYAFDQRLAENSYRPPYYPGFVSSRLTIVDVRYGGVQTDVTRKKNKIIDDLGNLLGTIGL